MLRNQILDIKKQNLQNQPEIKELEQYRRRLHLRFEGIPTAKNETNDSFFFSVRVFFHGHWQLAGGEGKGREGTIFYSTLPLPRAHEHSDINLQLCTWDDYHIFLIAMLLFTRLLLGEIYHLIELLFDWLNMWCWFLFICLLIWF